MYDRSWFRDRRPRLVPSSIAGRRTQNGTPRSGRRGNTPLVPIRHGRWSGAQTHRTGYARTRCQDAPGARPIGTSAPTRATLRVCHASRATRRASCSACSSWRWSRPAAGQRRRRSTRPARAPPTAAPPGAYPDLEAMVPARYMDAAPETLDSGRNCSDANLGSLPDAGIDGGPLRRRDVDLRGGARGGARRLHVRPA